MTRPGWLVSTIILVAVALALWTLSYKIAPAAEDNPCWRDAIRLCKPMNEGGQALLGICLIMLPAFAPTKLSPECRALITEVRDKK